jgi:hypothetical protein
VRAEKDRQDVYIKIASINDPSKAKVRDPSKRGFLVMLLTNPSHITRCDIVLNALGDLSEKEKTTLLIHAVQKLDAGSLKLLITKTNSQEVAKRSDIVDKALERLKQKRQNQEPANQVLAVLLNCGATFNKEQYYKINNMQVHEAVQEGDQVLYDLAKELRKIRRTIPKDNPDIDKITNDIVMVFNSYANKLDAPQIEGKIKEDIRGCIADGVKSGEIVHLTLWGKICMFFNIIIPHSKDINLADKLVYTVTGLNIVGTYKSHLQECNKYLLEQEGMLTLNKKIIQNAKYISEVNADLEAISKKAISQGNSPCSDVAIPQLSLQCNETRSAKQRS